MMGHLWDWMVGDWRNGFTLWCGIGLITTLLLWWNEDCQVMKMLLEGSKYLTSRDLPFPLLICGIFLWVVPLFSYLCLWKLPKKSAVRLQLQKVAERRRLPHEIVPGGGEE